MDPLGKKGEDAIEGLENVSGRVERLESRIEALDTALQGFMEESKNLFDSEISLDSHEIEELESIYWEVYDARERSENAEEIAEDLKRRQREVEMKLEEVYSKGFIESFGKITNLVKDIRRSIIDFESEIERIDRRVDEVENDVLIEANKRDYDFDQKLDKTEFESERFEMMEEIRKLRASVNILADELDKKSDIEID